MTSADRVAPRAVELGTEPPPMDVPCDVCGGPTYEVRCKIICLRCGFTRDCSDP